MCKLERSGLLMPRLAELKSVASAGSLVATTALLSI
jgi:hypothetical protein